MTDRIDPGRALAQAAKDVLDYVQQLELLIYDREDGGDHATVAALRAAISLAEMEMRSSVRPRSRLPRSASIQERP